MPRLRSRLLLLGVIAAAAALPSTAHAAEAVTDGGFESGGSAWTRSGYAGFCSTSTCMPDNHRTGAYWAALGGGSDPANPLSTPGSLSQSVPLTATPATLTLYVKVVQGSAGQFASLQPTIDGASLGAAVDAMDMSYASYKLVTRDLAPYANGANHTIGLTFTGSSGSAVIRPTFMVDDISVQVPSLPTPPVVPTPPSDPDPTPTPEPTPTPTPSPDTPTCHGRTATLIGTNEGELLDGSPKADVIYAAGGNDVVRGGAGNDIVCGGAGNDEIKGAAGKDRLYGDEGRDKLNGGGGTGDRCVGGPSRDKASPSCEKSKTL